MTINLPVDADTERLAKKLAEVTGKELPTVIREAIEAKAAAAGVSAAPQPPCSHDMLLDRMMAITATFADLPVLDTRGADEILNYDEYGVPR